MDNHQKAGEEQNKSSGKKKKIMPRRALREILIIVSSAFCGAFVQICVMIPCGMTSGGLPGIARLITHFFPINYSVLYYLMSMVVVVVVFITMGWEDVSKILALSFTYPVMLYLFERSGYVLLEEPDPFLAAMLIGLFYGLATGIGYIGGYASGGTDSIARVLKYKVFSYIPIGTIQLVMDGAIILISAFVFNMNVALYAVVAAVVSAKVISMIMVGVSGQFVQFDIIASDPQPITDFILHDIGRAVTSHVSRGEYSGTERRTLTVICTPKESIRIKQFIAEQDPTAFATIQHITTVWGKDKGFADIRKVDNN
ncbi:MAG: YitT family protein [Mogibacterium sp.]|nr:YitT family protein [Mogibacterium sp.]